MEMTCSYGNDMLVGTVFFTLANTDHAGSEKENVKTEWEAKARRKRGVGRKQICGPQGELSLPQPFSEASEDLAALWPRFQALPMAASQRLPRQERFSHLKVVARAQVHSHGCRAEPALGLLRDTQA